MTLSFACPCCGALVEAADELAGHSGRCARCRQVFDVPAPGRDEPSPASITATAPPAGPRLKRKPMPPSQPRSVPPARSRPPWGWFGALLLLSIFIVALRWHKHPKIDRRPEVQAPVPAMDAPAQEVMAGRLQEKRAFLVDGVFQVRSELEHTDPTDPLFHGMHCKTYEIELIANRTYLIEQDSHLFDCMVRVFDRTGQVACRGTFGIHKAELSFTPRRTEVHTIYATCMQPAYGPFTLTVREVNQPPVP